MKRHIPSVTIGIAAYNEERNIERILRAVLAQKQDGWRLNEILVHTDACSDRTNAIVHSIHNPRIRLHAGKTRRGKVFRVNEMLRRMKGDILVILDADLTLEGPNVITPLVRALSASSKTVLAGGNTRPFPPKTFMERAVYATFMVFEQSRIHLRNGHNIFGCNGGCIALTREFGRTITIPNVINEDDYLYFSCLSRGLSFRHVPRAVVYYKLPKSVRDYLRQSFRSNPDAVTLNFTKYFGDVVGREYHRPFWFLLRAVAAAFAKYPVETAAITLLNIGMKPFYRSISTKYKLEWYAAQSTK